MGDEIDKYMLQKLNDATEEARTVEMNLPAKIFAKRKLSKDFEDIKVSLSKPVGTDQSNTRREQLCYLNNVLTEWQTVTKKPFSLSSDSISSLYNLGQSLKKIKQDLRGENGGSNNRSQNPDPRINPNSVSNGTTTGSSTVNNSEDQTQYRWSSRYVDEEKVHGMQDKVLSMQRLLVRSRGESDGFKAFGIFGMAGIGKTTLCQLIFSNTRVKQHFLPRIWVCLSKQKVEDGDYKKEIVIRMLMCLGVDDEIVKEVDKKEGLKGLILALRLQLTGKRYLIVLDDARSTEDHKWFKMTDSIGDVDEESRSSQFSYGLPKDCGGAVVVTSRFKEVAKSMVDDDENLRCLPLSDNETCWRIFRDCVEKDGVAFPADLESLKEEILKRCDGLPLAAKMMGEIKHDQILKGATANPAARG